MRAFHLGLTGSIGMGKSTTAGFFLSAGIAVWDADAAVHRIYAPDGAAFEPVAKLVPAAATDQGLSREAMKQAITSDPNLLGRIEEIVHPLVAADRIAFSRTSPGDLLVFDIPLLFEKGTEAEMDATLLVTAPPRLQRSRVLARANMTEDQFNMILSRQMPDAEKRSRATHIIETLSLGSVSAQVTALIDYIRGQRDA